MLHAFADLKPFRSDPLSFLLARGVSSQQPVTRLRFGPKPVWLLTDPAHVRSILRADEMKVDKGRFVSKLRPIVGDSTLTINGTANAVRRAVLHGAMAKGTALRFVPEMSAAIRETAVNLLGMERFSAHEITAPLTLRLICIALFGKDVLSRGDEQAIIEAVRLVEADLADELFRVLPILNPIAAIAKHQRRQRARAMMDLVVSRVRDRAGASSILAALRDLGLTNAELRDEIVTMLLAGHHTTGSAAAWLLYYLATVPGLGDTLAREARDVSGPDGEIRPNLLPRAKVSAAFVREVLRLYPSAHWFSRDAREDLMFGDQKVARGDAILISPWHLHRDPRYWKDPEAFDLSRSHSSNAFLPFGAGPRVCIGMGLAMLELQLVALELAAGFQFAMCEGSSVGWPTPSVTLIPPEMELSLSVRRPMSSIAPLRLTMA